MANIEFQGVSPAVLARDYAPAWVANKFYAANPVYGGGVKADNSTDNSTALAAVVAAAAAAGGGVVELPAGRIKFGSLWDLSNLTTVPITFTAHGNGGDTANPGTALIYTGTGSGHAIHLGSSRGIWFQGVYFTASSASFTGVLVDLQKINGGGDTCFIGFSEFQAYGGASASPEALFCFDGSHNITLRRGKLANAQFGIIGKRTQGISASGGYAISVKIDDVDFTGGFTGAPIKNADESWDINATFEPLTGGAACAYTHDSGILANGVLFRSCWMGDDTAGVSGTWITFAGNGLALVGGRIGANTTTTAVKIDANNCSGLTSLGVSYVGLGGSSKAWDFGSTSGHTGFVLLGGALAGITTAVAGTIPTDSTYDTGGGLTVGAFNMTGSLTVPGTVTAQQTAIGVSTSPNLLTANQSVMSTDNTAWTVNQNCTRAAGTFRGQTALALTATGSVASNADMSVFLASGVAVTVGAQYTGLCSFAADTSAGSARTIVLDVQFLNGTGTVVGSRTFSSGTDTTTGWVQLSVTATAPATAVTAREIARISGPFSTGEKHWITFADIAAGSSTVYQPPGSQFITCDGNAIYPTGGSTNVDMPIRSKGTGQVKFNVSPGTGTGGVAVGDGAGNKVHQLNASQVGFFNATPVAQQSLAAAATDAATTQTLANSLRTALIALGLGV